MGKSVSLDLERSYRPTHAIRSDGSSSDFEKGLRPVRCESRDQLLAKFSLSSLLDMHIHQSITPRCIDDEYSPMS